MTDTHTTSQAGLDAQTYEAYVRNGENKAATSRELGISASTVADRIKRHQARQAQDEAAAPAELPDPVHNGDVFARIEASDPELRAIREAAAMFAGQPEQAEDPDESVTALLEQGEPETGQAAVTEVAPNVLVIRPDAIAEFVAQVNADAEAAGQAGQDTYQGPVCPECDAVAFSFKSGHQTGCRYSKIADAVRNVETSDQESGPAPRAGTEDDKTEVAQSAQSERVLVAECERCGFHFSRAQARTTCQSASACKKRQEAKAAAAAGAAA